MDNPLLSATKQANDEMQSLFDHYLPYRRPVSLEDYDWQLIKPQTVDQQFLEALGFVTLVESNPTAPGANILAAADRSNAPWLRHFITQTWLPEESMHHVPYKEYLVRSGTYGKAFLDAEIDKVVERGFVHGNNYTELQAATYGWLQELITWRFYDAMRSYLISNGTQENPPDSVLVKILGDIAKQENFHRHIYLTGAKTVLKYSPDRKEEVVATVAEFLMPGHEMAPDWQPKAPIWSKKFNFPIRQLMHDIVRGLLDLTGYNGLGQAAILYGSKNRIHWYFKPIVTALTPLSWAQTSPLNYLTGRLIARIF